MTLTAARMDWTVHFVNTGVPHAVLFMDEVASADVRGLGHAIRNHEAFQPAGANVNFAQMTAPGAMRLRTYERGVEDETLACGTGAAAAAYVAKALGLTEEETKVTPTGGADQVLNIGVEGKKVFLEGPAEIVFEGVLNLEAVGL
jgi:diaminopimelate epimerase